VIVAAIAAFAGVLGLVIGSFIGVLTLRWPAGEGFITGRSRCDHCGHDLSARDLVPLLSYAALAGKCRHCGGRIAPRHLLIEVAAAAIGVLALLLHPGAEGWAGALFGWGLLALAILDAEHFWLPDALTLPLGLAGFLAGLWLAPPLTDRAIGALAGFAILSVIALAFKLATGRDGLGGGDPKIFAAIGAWLGWQALGPVLLGASLIGIGYALVAALAGRNISGKTQLPLGTLLALAAWPIWLFGLPAFASP
jgi:leader peptidase (prepilin peptidase)/N-methyltransferase